MKLNNLEEHADGSATVNLDLTVEEAQTLMQMGFVQLLEGAIADDKRRRKIPAIFQPMESYGGDD